MALDLSEAEVQFYGVDADVAAGEAGGVPPDLVMRLLAGGAGFEMGVDEADVVQEEPGPSRACDAEG